MPRRANTQTQQEAVQENAAVQANAGADMQMEATITKTPVSYTHLDVYKRQILYWIHQEKEYTQKQSER